MPDEKTPEQIEAERREQDAIAARKAEAAPVVEPKQDYITRDAFLEFQRQQNEQFQQLLTTLQPRREEPKPEPTVNYDAEIQKAQDEGNLDRVTELRIQKAQKPLLDRISAFEQFGVGALENISSQVALQTDSDRKIYQRYKKEIDSFRSTMPAQYRATPESLQSAVTYVKGQHHEEILAAEREAWAREAAGRKDTTGSTPSPTESSRGKKPERLPTPDEYFNNDEAKLAEIERVGGPDRFAQKVSGGRNKTWNEWVEKGLKIMGKPVPEKKAS